MNEYEVRKAVMASDEITSTEKLIMFAILMKVNWEQFCGPVSINQIVEMTSIKKRTVQRGIKRLTEIQWISRTSSYIEKQKSTIAHTEILINNIAGVSSVSSVSNITPVSSVSSPSVTNDTPLVSSVSSSSVTNDIHTISYNNNQFSNNNEETESDCFSESDSISIEGDNDDFWLYPSSIQDASQRLAAQSYVQAHYHRLSYSERQRYMFPELTKPIWNNVRTTAD